MGNCNICMEDKPSGEVGIQNFAPAAKQKPQKEKPIASQETFAPEFMPQPYVDIEGARSTSKQETAPFKDAEGLRLTPKSRTSPEPSEDFMFRETANFRPPSSQQLAHITTLQTAIRAALERRRLHQRESSFRDEPNPSGGFTETFTATNLDPESFLSPAARTTLRGLPPLQYEYNIKGVAWFPARLLSDGSIYIGEWGSCGAHTFRKGKGKLFKRSSPYYEGYWSSGCLQPKGRVIYENGDYYEGAVLNGLKHGYGVLRGYNRTVYKGDWMNDLKHGKGEETMADGLAYVGSFERGVRNGKGKQTTLDGKVYEGEFLNNEMTGEGEFRWPDGRRYKGGWLKGKMHGTGTFHYADGKVYTGDYVNDHKHGHGVYVWDGNTYEGPWVNGQMHGKGYLTGKGKARKLYQFVNGVRGSEVTE